MLAHERHYSRGRQRHPSVPADADDQQATAARLRQADDLLPGIDADARGDSRAADHQHAARRADDQGTAW